jgi:hypothetical protein
MGHEVTLAPGIHASVDASVYHDGCTDTPSLSASIARILIGKSPAHARAAHPILNPNLVREESDKFAIGTAAHKLFLEGEDAIAVCTARDWRTSEAKAFRDEQREFGKIPLLLEQAGDVRSMVAEAHAQVAAHRAKPALFTDGKPERTLIWEDELGAVCRARLDWLRDDYEAIDDYKTTSASADPAAWTKTMYGIGGDVQVAFYMRGVERLTGIKPVFRYVVQETYPPYALSVVDLAPSALAIANDKVERAIELWAWCLESNSWPAYDKRVASIEVPTYEEMRWLERVGEVAA